MDAFSSSRWLKLSAPAGPGEDYWLPPEKLISGNPKQTAWTQYTDSSGKFYAGIWRSEPGKWKISYTEEEYCLLIEGMSIISHDDGISVTVKAGDRFVIPQGFSGSWEVVEQTTKQFVIYEP